MTKRQQLGFTFLTCGLAALAFVACSDGGDDSPFASTGGGSGFDPNATGGATGSGGGSATGGGSSTINTGGGSATPPPANSTYTVQAGGFVTSGTWQGYAWPATENPTVGSTIVPADFTAVLAGDTICVSGTVAAEPDYQGVAMLGFNINQPVEGGDGSEGTWAYTGTMGVEYAVTMNVDSPLRIQIQGPLGYPDEAWCANAGDGTGQIPWTDFNKTCWDNKGTYYDADGFPALEAVMFLVPGDDNTPTPFDFCVSSIGPY